MDKPNVSGLPDTDMLLVVNLLMSILNNNSLCKKDKWQILFQPQEGDITINTMDQTISNSSPPT